MNLIYEKLNKNEESRNFLEYLLISSIKKCGLSFYKLKTSLATYPTSNAKSLARDTANEHALTCTRETCSRSQTVVQ